jgi:hypothetical protein
LDLPRSGGGGALLRSLRCHKFQPKASLA